MSLCEGNCLAQGAASPLSHFKSQFGLSDSQLGMLAQGSAVAKTLSSGNPSELYLFGAIFIQASPESYVELSFDMERLKKTPNYLGVGKFSDPPRLTGLEGFTLEPADISSIPRCKPGKCGVQLTEQAMNDLKRAASNPSAGGDVNQRMRQMAIDLVESYKRQGNQAVGVFRDVDPPFHFAPELRAFAERQSVLPVRMPELRRYILDYPNATLPNVKSVYYWEKVEFGLKPTLRINHGFAYESDGPLGPAHAVVLKQIYASHYFQLALDIALCVPGKDAGGRQGFYLVTLKTSTQQGLTGFTGSMLRRVVVSKMRSSQEKVLVSIKKTLEQR